VQEPLRGQTQVSFFGKRKRKGHLPLAQELAEFELKEGRQFLGTTISELTECVAISKGNLTRAVMGQVAIQSGDIKEYLRQQNGWCTKLMRNEAIAFEFRIPQLCTMEEYIQGRPLVQEVMSDIVSTAIREAPAQNKTRRPARIALPKFVHSDTETGSGGGATSEAQSDQDSESLNINMEEETQSDQEEEVEGGRRK
jgi:hypothetical protein